MRVIAVSVLLGTGCLVPNPAWSETNGGSGGTGTGTSMGTTVTATAPETTVASAGESGSDSGTTTGGELPPTVFCEPLPDVPGGAVIVPAGSTIPEINDAIAVMDMGGVVALEPGTYTVGDQPVVLGSPGVTLRSTTGRPSDVVLDGGGTAGVLVRMRARGTVLAGVTLAGATDGVILGGEGNISGVTITHVQIVDMLGDGVATIADPVDGQYVDEIEIACSTFRITEELRVGLGEGCLPFKAIDVDASRDSIVRDNRFSDYFCDLLATSGVTVEFSAGSRDTIVERNHFANHFRGVIFGGRDPARVTEPARIYDDNPCGGGYWGHIGGVIRNNLFWNGSDAILASAPGAIARTDSAISFWTVCDGAAYHNTVVSLMDPDDIFAGIEWRWPTTTVEVINNLVTDTLMQRQEAVLTVGAGNLELANPNEVIDPLGGDLHLAPTASARGGGVPLAAVTEDFEGDARDAPPDVGADEAE